MLKRLKKYVKSKIQNLIQAELSQTKVELAQTKTELSQTKAELYSLFQLTKREHGALILNLSNSKTSASKKKVVYTCLTGNYDKLYLPEYIDNEWDYVCYTDNVNLLKNKTYGIWKVFPLHFSDLDNTRNNRWHKTHPHILFPDYEESLYIDSNLIIRSNWIFKIILNVDKNIIIPTHFVRNCIYDEIEAVKNAKIDDEQIIQKMNIFLQENNFPHNYGMNENNCIYRRHNEPEIIAMMEEWWTYIRDYSKRDQLSLSYVLWKHGIKPSEIAIPNLRIRYRDFQFITHLSKKNEIVSLPDYPLEEAEIQYNIDAMKTTLNYSFISGWAYLHGHKGQIFVGNINSRIYVTKPNEMNMAFTGVVSKFGMEIEIYKPTIVSRPDVQELFHLESSDVGFSIETDTFISDFSIYLVDEDVKKIFFTQCRNNF